MSIAAAEPVPSPPRVSVVVPVRDDPARIERCVAALQRSTFDDFEILVVDDASTTPRTADLAEAAGVRVLRLKENVGPAAARNAGARMARGAIVYFVDADCIAHPDAVARVAETLTETSPYDAVFGSYGLDPEHPALISRWKNLSHRHTHQVSREEAGTFWSGCGAMRRDVFLAFGGFDETYGRPCIEDVELGMRLKASGRRIRLDKDLQVEHLKRWDWPKLIRTDIFDRGVPWTRVMLAMSRDGGAKLGDLNVGPSQKVAALAAAALVCVFLVGGIWKPWLWLVPVAAVLVTLVLDALSGRGVSWKILSPAVLLAQLFGWVGLFWYSPPAATAALVLVLIVVSLNAGLYRMLARRAGIGFTVAGLVPHILYFHCGLTGYAIGTISHLLRPRPLHPGAPLDRPPTLAGVASES